MVHVYWFIAGFIICQGLNLWWFRGNLKQLLDGWKTTLANKIKGWLT